MTNIPAPQVGRLGAEIIRLEREIERLMDVNSRLLRRALEAESALHQVVPEHEARSLFFKTTCGRCDYDEADGSLIKQCQDCKDADAGIVAGVPGGAV